MKTNMPELQQKINAVIKLFHEEGIVDSPLEAMELVRNHPTLPAADKALLLEKMNYSNMMLMAYANLCLQMVF